ncbi:MAG: hypothetical protein AB1324_01185 [Candidatus Micrarchaeota archaeon]
MTKVLSVAMYALILSAGSAFASPVFEAELDPYLGAIQDDWTAFGCDEGWGEWSCVDDNEGTEDYLKTNDINIGERFYMENLPSSAESVDYVKVRFYAERYDWIKNRFTVFLWNTSEDYYQISIIEATSIPEWHEVVLHYNPMTHDPWTVSDVNNLQLGMNSRTGWFSGAKVYSMDMIVGYRT